jgi:alcohol dehydrogenase class IV
VVVGIGGGSVLDAAKVASMTVANPGSIKQYIGANKVKKHGLPSILIPTTAGTGSEASLKALVPALFRMDFGSVLFNSQ